MSAVNYFLKMNLHECKPQNNHNDPNFPGGSAPRPGTSRPTVTQLAARGRNEGKGHNPPPHLPRPVKMHFLEMSGMQREKKLQTVTQNQAGTVLPVLLRPSALVLRVHQLPPTGVSKLSGQAVPVC